MQKFNKKTFQEIILILQDYWALQGCSIVQPLDIEVGAGTSHPATSLRALGREPMATAYVQPSRRPTDSRYGQNQNRLQHYYQFQVVIKPSPDNFQELYLDSLKELGIDSAIHDIRFIESNWENLTLGSWGIGWEIWINGMEITQFTYFQQVGGLECRPITGEITYGLERLAMCIQEVDSVYDLVWSNGIFGRTTYADMFYQNEVEQSIYNFEYADVDFLFTCFNQYEKETRQLLALDIPLPLPAYERILKAVHIFNLLDARKAISITERQRYILRLRTLTKAVAEVYCTSRTTAIFNVKQNKLQRENA